MRLNTLTYIIFAFIICISLSACQVENKESVTHTFLKDTTFENPIIKGFYPDPSISGKDSNFYLVTSSFEYFPGIPVFHSTDLVNWNQIGYALTRKSQLNLDSVRTSGGVWAPTIRYHNGLFYIITTRMHDGKNFYVTAENPAGPWSEPVFMDIQCIDPSLFFDDDGKVYFTGNTPWDGRTTGIYQAEIDLETGKLLTEYRKIWEGSGGRHPEGPHLYKMNDYYYLMIAEGGTEAGHMETIARSKSPWGPFEECPHNPILTNRNEAHNKVQNTGHGDLIKGPDGKWWMVHLAVRTEGKYHHLGRETFLAAVEWDDKGWPLVNRNGTSSIYMHAVPPDTQVSVNHDFYTDFNEGTELNMQWNFIRNPKTERYSLSENPGYLSLQASEISLNDFGSPTFLGIRQKDFKMEAITQMRFDAKNGHEAGLTVFMNANHFYSVSLVQENEEKVIVASMKIGEILHQPKKIQYSANEVWFKISADIDYYTLYASSDGKNWTFMGENSTRYLSSEVAGGFTGTYVALFATTNKNEGKSTAMFDSFSVHYQ